MSFVDSKTPRIERRLELKEFGVVPVDKNRHAMENADVVMFAVKPQTIDKVLKDAKRFLSPDCLVISIVAGATMSRKFVLYNTSTAECT